MKNLILVLVLLPSFVIGQDTPMDEIKVSTEQMEKKERTKQLKERKSFIKKNKKIKTGMSPKNQIGYINNPIAHPWGGVNYFNYFSSSMGWYVDFRPALNGIHPDNFTSYDDSDAYVLFEQTLWTSVINVGFSYCVKKSYSSATMIYLGIGGTRTKTYSAYEPNIEPGYWYIEDGGEINDTNFNIGLLRQSTGLLSWQIGYDTGLKGMNFGIGFTLD